MKTIVIIIYILIFLILWIIARSIYAYSEKYWSNKGHYPKISNFFRGKELSDIEQIDTLIATGIVFWPVGIVIFVLVYGTRLLNILIDKIYK